MKKQDIIAQVSAMEDLPAEEVEAVVDELLNLVEQRMKMGEETQIYSFGKFGVRWWRGRTGRDPQTGEEIEIEGRWMPYWTPSPTLIEEESPQTATAGAGKGKSAHPKLTEKKEPHSQAEAPEAPAKKTKETEQKETPHVPAESEKSEKLAEPAGVTDALEDREKDQESISKKVEEKPAEQDISEDVPETSSSGAEIESGKEPAGREPELAKSEQESSPLIDTEDEEDRVYPDEKEPDWQDIGDEISMEELRFISRQLEEEPEESAAGLFFFDEEETPPEESEEKHESEFIPENLENSEAFGPEGETSTEESEGEMDVAPPVSEELEWAITERKRGKLGWVAILMLSIALVAFGAFALIQDHWPQFPSFLSKNAPGISLREASPLNEDQSAEISGGTAGAGSTEPSSGETANLNDETGGLAPYDFGRARRANFLVIYTAALDSFQADKYLSSARILSRLLASNPPGDYIDNIHYWLGECRFAQSQYRRAVREFEMVFESPVANKAEDALIMMAQSYLRLNDLDQAREILIRFRNQFPNSQYTGVVNRWLREYNLIAEE